MITRMVCNGLAKIFTSPATRFIGLIEATLNIMLISLIYDSYQPIEPIANIEPSPRPLSG